MSTPSGRSYVIPASPTHRMVISGFKPQSHTEAEQMSAVLDDHGVLLNGCRLELFRSPQQHKGHSDSGSNILNIIQADSNVTPLNTTALFFFLANPEFAAAFADAVIVLFPGTIHLRDDGVSCFWGMMKGPDNAWSMFAYPVTIEYNKDVAFAVLRKKP